jgi:hypothetical protein
MSGVNIRRPDAVILRASSHQADAVMSADSSHRAAEVTSQGSTGRSHGERRGVAGPFPSQQQAESFAVEKLITARKLLDTGSRGGERVGDKRSIAVQAIENIRNTADTLLLSRPAR